MSESIFDWVKENPVTNIPDKRKIPPELMSEWNWLSKHTTSTKDSTLWCYKLVKNGTPKKKGCDLFWKASWLHDRLYSLWQLSLITWYQTQSFIRRVDDAFVIVARDISMEMLTRCVHYDRNLSVSKTLAYCMTTYNGSFVEQREIDKLFLNCTMDMITRNGDKIGEVLQLLRDTKNDDGVTWTSLTQLRKAHDEQAEAEIQEKLKTVGENHWQFAQELVDLCGEHGYAIFTHEKQFVQRGIEHSNCVAGYYQFMGTKERLIIGRNDVTCEMRFQFRHGHCVSVQILQHKGRFNKDVEIPVNLTKLQIRLTGKPIAWFTRKEVTSV